MIESPDIAVVPLHHWGRARSDLFWPFMAPWIVRLMDALNAVCRRSITL